MIAKESFGLPNRRNRRKNQLQSTQEMVNAVDKVSVSIRRAFNVNRCQQDNLDNRVWTLERECRQSLGLLTLEQRKFIRSRKPPVTRLKIEANTKDIPEISNTFVGNLGIKNASKGSIYLPTLVNEFKFHCKGHAINRHRLSCQGGFKELKKKQGQKKEQSDELIRLPPLTDKKMSKPGDNECNHTPKVKRTTSEDIKIDKEMTEKQESIHSSEVNGKGIDGRVVHYSKKIGNLKTLSSLYDEDAKKLLEDDPQINKHISNQNYVESETNSNRTEIRKGSQIYLLSSIPSLIRGQDSDVDKEALNLDKATEVKVKKFLKLPPIGGIQDTPDSQDDSSKDQLQTRLREQSSVGKPHQSAEIKDKSHLWRSLVHCRYLRINERHQSENILDEVCRCNWCSMMKKNKM